MMPAYPRVHGSYSTGDQLDNRAKNWTQICSRNVEYCDIRQLQLWQSSYDLCRGFEGVAWREPVRELLVNAEHPGPAYELETPHATTAEAEHIGRPWIWKHLIS